MSVYDELGEEMEKALRRLIGDYDTESLSGAYRWLTMCRADARAAEGERRCLTPSP